MADQKLTYKVDVDTGSAVRDLDKLGQAGEDAGKQIAQGFDQAESKSKSAIQALSAELDKVEQDAKAAAAAVSAIKANLTVDVDDSKVAQFASDIRSKMGVTFDEITADAKAFADVLERGVNMDKTRTELRGVGDEMGHVRSESDQSRSVLANLAGNAAQDFGELGGVVGSLGVGVGQLAEYAVDGTIGLQNLAKVAGPMAALSATLIVVQNVMGNIAATKAFDADQLKAFSDAFGELGDTSLALSQSLAGVFNARVDDNSIWGQLTGAQKTEDLADNLAEVGVKLEDIDNIIRSGASDRASFELLPDVQNLDRILQGAGLSVDEYEAIMDGVFESTQNWTRATEGAVKSAEFFGSSLSEVNEILKGQLIAENPFAIFDMGLFQTGGHLVDLRAIWHDVVADMRDNDASFDTTAGNIDVLAEAMRMDRDEVIALARETGQAAKAQGELQTKTTEATAAATDQADAIQDQVDALQALIDKQNDMLSSTNDLADAQQAWDDGLAAFPATVEESTKALDKEKEGSTEWIAARNDQRDALEELVEQYVTATELQAQANGEQLTAVQRVDAQARALGMLAGTLDSRTIPAVADYYSELFKIPDSRRTDFEMVLKSGDQAAIEAFVSANSGTKTLAIAVEADQAKLAKVSHDVGAVTGPRTVPVTAVAYTSAAKFQLAGLDNPLTVKVHADTAPADETLSWWRRLQGQTAVTVPVQAGVNRNSGGGQVGQGGAVRSVGAPAALSLTPAVDEFGDDVTPAPSAAVAPSNVWMSTSAAAAAPVRPVTINVAVSAGVIGNRFDVERAVLRAVRSGTRLRGAGALVSP